MKQRIDVLQLAPQGVECLWRSDAGWQTVSDARSSDKEGPVTLWNDAMTTLQEQMLTHSAVASCVNVRHTTQLVHQILRSRTMQTVEHEHAELKLNSLTHRQPMKVAE